MNKVGNFPLQRATHELVHYELLQIVLCEKSMAFTIHVELNMKFITAMQYKLTAMQNNSWFLIFLSMIKIGIFWISTNHKNISE